MELEFQGVYVARDSGDGGLWAFGKEPSYMGEEGTFFGPEDNDTFELLLTGAIETLIEALVGAPIREGDCWYVCGTVIGFIRAVI